MKKANLIALDGNIVHGLEAKEQSTVRLSLVRMDYEKRVKNVTIISNGQYYN